MVGFRIKYGNLEVGNTTQQLMSTTGPCCSSGFIASFLFESFYIQVSYIQSFFVIFNCNFFSALHAKHFEIWKNILWNCWLDYFIARSTKWCDISGCSWWIHFPFYRVFFFQENCVSFGLLVSCLSLSQSA